MANSCLFNVNAIPHSLYTTVLPHCGLFVKNEYFILLSRLIEYIHHDYTVAGTVVPSISFLEVYQTPCSVR